MNPFKAWAALRRGDWAYGLPRAVVDSTDREVVDAVFTGWQSIEEHRKRLGQPAEAKSGKHAATAEEGR